MPSTAIPQGCAKRACLPGPSRLPKSYGAPPASVPSAKSDNRNWRMALPAASAISNVPGIAAIAGQFFQRERAQVEAPDLVLARQRDVDAVVRHRQCGGCAHRDRLADRMRAFVSAGTAAEQRFHCAAQQADA